MHRARKELSETDATRAAALTALTQTLCGLSAEGPAASAGVLSGLAADPPFLLTFLRWAKFSLPAAATRAAAFAAFVSAHPWAAAPDEATLRRVYEHGAVGFSPQPTADGRVIATVRVGPALGLITQAGLGALNRAAFWAFCALLRDPVAAISGVVFVEDLRGCADSRMVRVVRSAENAVSWRIMQEVLPLRLQGIYFLHPPLGMGLLWAVLSRFLGSKVRRRVRVVGSCRAAREALVLFTSLPVEMGGAAVVGAAYSSELALAGLRATPWMASI